MGDDAKVGAATAAPTFVYIVHILDYAGRTIGRYNVSAPGGMHRLIKRAARMTVVEDAARDLLDRRLPGMSESDYAIIAGFRVEGP